MSGFRLAVLASGTGTNLQAILDQLHGRDGIEVVAVASNKADAQALERAGASGIETGVFGRADYPDREARDTALADWLEERDLDLIVLAGYMELLSSGFVQRFRNRIINVHPALLPAFPGIDAIEQSLAHGVKVTGVTVHFVDEGVDSGPIILQRAIDVPYTRDVADVEHLVHPIEHELLPRAIRLIAAGAVEIDEQNPRLVRIKQLEAPAAARAVGRMSAQGSSETETPAAEARGDDGQLKVRTALISVSDKTGVAEFAAGLGKLGVQIVSTGGTLAALKEAGVEARGVEELTGSPEILDGRVKTLHPRLHAALLARRDDPAHMSTLEAEGIEPIDLVCVNLYPFEQTVSGMDVSEAEVIENIDIGGPTMIRAAAKNHMGVAVVVKPESYDAVLAELEESDGEVSLSTRHWLANEAFACTARYDAAISRWFAESYEDFPEHKVIALEKELDLTYGENPHQRAALYTEAGARSHVLSRVGKLHGKPLSFNNVLDLDSARRLLGDFDDPACVIVKHNNPCGVGIGETTAEAYEKALACDPMSAFGGVIALNGAVDTTLAKRLHENFIEVLISPGYHSEALEVLQQKEAIRILEDEERRQQPAFERDVKRVRGGLLIQDRDGEPEARELMEVVTKTQPPEEQWADLLFAWTVVRHVRSNAIVLARDRATLGIGAGQMSRVDSVRLAIEKEREARGDGADELLKGSVVASDAFFPFADGPEAAIKAGATAVIQPGGSKRDAEVIEACDAAGVAMVFTKHRHFRH